MTSLISTIRIAVAAATIMTFGSAAGHLPQEKPSPSCAPEQRPTEYAAVKGDVYLIYARVVDYAAGSECRGEDCAPLPLLRLKVLTSFRGDWNGELLMELPYLAQQPEHPESIRKGDLLMVTFTKDTSRTMWSCGSLRACKETPPEYVLRVIDVFRHLRWG
jgi:hypothetical protein